MQEFRQILKQAAANEPDWTRGVREGERDEIIGRISDASILAGGDIALLDAGYYEVRLYTPGGRPKDTFGAQGLGPGEFEAPYRVFSGNRSIIVFDRRNKVDIFKPSSGKYRHYKRFSLPAFPDDVCILGDRLYTRSPDLARTAALHSVTLSGERTNSFGGLYQDDSGFIVQNMSAGSVGCDAHSRKVVTGYTRLPLLEGYTTDGNQIWTTRLQSVRPLKRRESTGKGGRLQLSSVTDGRTAYSGLWRIEDAPGALVVIQIRKMTKAASQDGKPYAAIQTYLVSSQTGQGMYVGNEIGPILDLTNRRLVTGTNFPFPQVKVWSLGIGPDFKTDSG